MSAFHFCKEVITNSVVTVKIGGSRAFWNQNDAKIIKLEWLKRSQYKKVQLSRNDFFSKCIYIFINDVWTYAKWYMLPHLSTNMKYMLRLFNTRFWNTQTREFANWIKVHSSQKYTQESNPTVSISVFVLHFSTYYATLSS